MNVNFHLTIGDCRDMNTIPDNTIDLIVTSPPYWNLKKYGKSDSEIGHSIYTEYISDLTNVFDECYRVGKQNSILIVNINSRRFKKQYYPIDFDIVANINGWKLWENIVWYIPNALPQCKFYKDSALDNKYETVLVFRKDISTSYTFNKIRVAPKYINDTRKGKLNPKGRCLGNVLKIPAYRPPNIKSKNYHIAAFPESLVSFLIETYSNNGDSILDPFIGSGTVAKVGLNLNRIVYGYEVNDSFQDLIYKRINEDFHTVDYKNIDIMK